MEDNLQIEFWKKFLAQAKPKIKSFQNINPIKRRDIKTVRKFQVPDLL